MMLLQRAVEGEGGLVGLALEGVAVVPPGEGVGLHTVAAVAAAAITPPEGMVAMGLHRVLVLVMGGQVGGLMVVQGAIGVVGAVVVTVTCPRGAMGMPVKEDIR